MNSVALQAVWVWARLAPGAFCSGHVPDWNKVLRGFSRSQSLVTKESGLKASFSIRNPWAAWWQKVQV